MTPVLVRLTEGTLALLVDFVTMRDEPRGVLVFEGGAVGAIPISDFKIERPNGDWPIGVGEFSAVSDAVTRRVL